MSTPVYDRWEVRVFEGDCLDVLRAMPDCSVHSVVTDPPAGIRFMNRAWDSDMGGRHSWVAWLSERMTEAYRVLKPGGHALVWAMPRTSHWTAWALEDAGFEVRDCIVHLFGSGMPKSLDVGKALDKRPGVQRHREFATHLAERRETVGLSRADVSKRVVGNRTGACWNWEHHQFPEARWWPALQSLLGLDGEWGAVIAEVEREVIGQRTTGVGTGRGSVALMGDSDNRDLTAPATDAARQWEGWGTSLKPSQEMWWLCRKPLSGTVSATVLEHGTGALNIGACRVATADDLNGGAYTAGRAGRAMAPGATPRHVADLGEYQQPSGRWPSNVVLTHSADCGTNEDPGPCVEGCPVLGLNRQSGVSTSQGGSRGQGGGRGAYGIFGAQPDFKPGLGDTGGASRFFPQFRWEAKAPARERPRVNGVAHPTCKSVGLMRWMTKLITPPGGTVLDLFAGTGTTGQAARAEGFPAILIESDPASIPLIKARLDALPKTEATAEPAAPDDGPVDLFGLIDGAAS